jgi:hypothetical protein
VVIIGVVRLRAHRESHAPHRRGSPSHRLRRFQKPPIHNSLLCTTASYAVALSKDSWHGQRIGDALAVEIDDGVMDG